MTQTNKSLSGKKMVDCICCKKNEGNIEVRGNAIFYICGQSNCESPKGEDIGEWFLQGSKEEDPNGNWSCYVKGQSQILFKINHKQYSIATDKRVLKGIKSKIQEIVRKQSGIENNNTN